MSTPKTHTLSLVLVAIVAAGCVTHVTQIAPQPAPVPAPAPAAPADSPSDDPPARVGRLGFLSGTISFRPAGDTEWSPAIPNRPVTTGDAVWADNDGRAEVQAGSATLRVDRQTELDVLRLDDSQIQVSVPQGTAIMRLRALAPDEVDEIDAPNAAIQLSTLGEYRVDVSPDGYATSVTVFSGSASVAAGGTSFTVNPGTTATVRGGEAPKFDLAYAGAPDEFDRWSRVRDASEDAAMASVASYVSPDMPGASDLTSYGMWQQDPSYGPMWYPVVAAGWAPYRFGHWVWVGRWGWTWVEDEPWGWAPFHYGRWAYVGGRWGWCPGRTVAQPVYAPALVVFVSNRGWSAEASFGPEGGVGWFPLAPDEVYRPPYAVSTVYVRRVNVTNAHVTNIDVTNVTVTNVGYRNREMPNAVTVVRHETFVNGAPVEREALRVPAGEIRRVAVVDAPHVVPTRGSLVSAEARNRRAAFPPPGLARRPVVAVHEPPPSPVPFSAQERYLARNDGRPLTHEQDEEVRREAPPAPATIVHGRPVNPHDEVATRPAMPTTVTRAPARAPMQVAQPRNEPSRVAPGTPIVSRTPRARDDIDTSSYTRGPVGRGPDGAPPNSNASPAPQATPMPAASMPPEPPHHDAEPSSRPTTPVERRGPPPSNPHARQAHGASHATPKSGKAERGAKSNGKSEDKGKGSSDDRGAKPDRP